MSLLRRVGHRLFPKIVKNYSIADLDADMMRDFSISTHAGVDMNMEQALRLSTVYACIRVKADTLASLPFKMMRRNQDGTRETVREHPLHRLLTIAPNEWMSAYQFKTLMQTHAEMRGNAYAKIDWFNGRIQRLVPLNPDCIEIEIPERGYELKYYFKDPKTGERKLIPQKEIFHLRNGLTLNGITGVNCIEYHREAYGLGLAAERHGSTIFGNGAHPGGVASFDGKLSDEQKGNLQKELNTKFGRDKANLWLVIDNGWKFEPLKISNVDAQYLELRQFQVEEICRIHNVPSVLVQHSDKASTYASAEQFFLSFAKFTVLPLTINWANEITKSLLTEDEQEEYYPHLSLSGLERADIKARFEAYRIGRDMGIWNADDILEMEDKNPVGGPEGQIRLCPANMRNLKELLNTNPEEENDSYDDTPGQ